MAQYYNRILNEFVINSTFRNPTYTPSALSKDQSLQNYTVVLFWTYSIYQSTELMNLNNSIFTGFLNFTKILTNIST
jgi:hypothetical protein